MHLNTVRIPWRLAVDDRDGTVQVWAVGKPRYTFRLEEGNLSREMHQAGRDIVHGKPLPFKGWSFRLLTGYKKSKHRRFLECIGPKGNRAVLDLRSHLNIPITIVRDFRRLAGEVPDRTPPQKRKETLVPKNLETYTPFPKSANVPAVDRSPGDIQAAKKAKPYNPNNSKSSPGADVPKGVKY